VRFKDDDGEIDEEKKRRRSSKGKKSKGSDSFDGEEDQAPGEDKENPFEYVELVKNAMIETKTILGQLDEHGSLYAGMWEIFNIFCGKVKNTENGDASESSLESSHNSDAFDTIEVASSNQKKTLQLIMLPQFLKYFKVAFSDELFFDECIRKLAVLAESEYYCTQGLTFSNLLLELHEKGFFIGCELTEKEAYAVTNA